MSKPARRHSYKAAMRPRQRYRHTQSSNDLPTTLERNDMPKNETAESTNNSESAKDSLIEDGRVEASDEDRPEPSRMSRASIGSQFSSFQIVPTETSIDEDNELSPNEEEAVMASSQISISTSLSSSSSEEQNQGMILNTVERVESSPQLITSSFIERSHYSQLPLPLMKMKDKASDIDTSDSEDCSLSETDPNIPSPDTGKRSNCSLSRAHSMSESDLSIADRIDTRMGSMSQEDVNEQEPQKKVSLERKNACRRKRNLAEELLGHKNRSLSVITPAHATRYSGLEEADGPALPKRNPLMLRVKISDDQSLSQPNGEPLTPRSVPLRIATQKGGGLSFKRYKLHNPKSTEKLIDRLKSGKYDQVERDRNGDTALHAIIRAKQRRDKHDLLLALMVYSDFGTEEIDIPSDDGSTALHIAIQNKDLFSVQILLAFGANINAVNGSGRTPLDLLMMDPPKDNDIWELLLSLDAESGSDKQDHLYGMRHTTNIARLLEREKKPQREEVSSTQLAGDLERNMNDMFRNYESIHDEDLQMSLGLQQFELRGWKVTAESKLHFQIKGRRILFLDGGGIRGLIQIEILMMLEKKTGKKITELFDWIVGTSTGGIVALGLVYGKKSLAEIRQFYFKMKNEVFPKSRFGLAGNTNATPALEEILKETLTSNARMSDVKEPKVLVTAVDKKTNSPQLVFFNNCLKNEFSDEYIWKVARYTSAAPMYFSSLNGYIDGGILANNPSEYGLTVIQNYYQRRRIRLDIACVVSVGSGTFPAKKLGSIDVHEVLGMQVLKVQKVHKRARNLMKLLTSALVKTDDAVTNCKSRCETQNIPFHRFSPTFQKITVESDETDNDLLIQMLIETKIQALTEWLEQLDELANIFDQAAGEIRLQKLAMLKEKKQRKQGRLNENTHAFSQ